MKQGHGVALALAVAALATVAAPVGGASAQTTTMTFAGLGPNNYDPIPVSHGSTSNLAVTNHSVVGFGNSGLAACGGTDNTLEYWGPGYSDLAEVVFQCFNGGVSQFFFQPTAGNRVTLNSLTLGSYASTNGVGPTRAYTLNIYDAAWNPLSSTSGTVDVTTTLTPGASSTTGLYLQLGTDWDVGIGSITTTVSPALSSVPEPATYALLVPGLMALGMLRRRRAAA